MDALRAVAIVGVVLGHWLVTAVVSDPNQPTALRTASPLTHVPELAPVTWFLQTLGLFFFAAGYTAARSAGRRKPLPWLASRLRRLLEPVLVLGTFWLVATALLAVVDTPSSTRHVVWTLVSQPLWFVLVYLALAALTPALRTLVVRFGPCAALPAVALIAVADAARPRGLPDWLELLAVPVAWAMPYVLGIALAEGRLSRRAGALLLPLGVVGGWALVQLAGYPASAVGVPGARWSNLDPPSLFALALTVAQLGTFLLLRPWLARLLQRPFAWAPVAVLNLTAMTVYCWHQTALLLVAFAGLLAGRPSGLLDIPTSDWIWHRLLWLPIIGLTLAVLTRLFHRYETRASKPVDHIPKNCRPHGHGLR